ncbi:MAG: hypothetical protein ABI968_15715, partial [Acidobacteriota bacterium]
MSGMKLAGPGMTVLAAGLAAVLLSTAAGAQKATPRGAKQYLASARELDRQALDGLRSPGGLSAARARVRASKADLGAALDTLGAAELSPAKTASIQRLLTAAATNKGRALRGSASRLGTSLQAALAQET